LEVVIHSNTNHTLDCLTTNTKELTVKSEDTKHKKQSLNAHGPVKDNTPNTGDELSVNHRWCCQVVTPPNTKCS